MAPFQRKIVTLEQLQALVGPRPRQRKVVLAHGVFDLLHPGHLRHLMYARDKADVLVASVTADVYVTKGNLSQNRPYVPEELRATQLAALELVDYVLIDHHPTPIALLTALQPEYLAKGYEYVAGGLPVRTQEEMDTLAVYGGEMVFTPGDVVYSSSAILDAHQPNLAWDKLLSLMQLEGVGFPQLQHTIQGMSGVPVHIVGDTIVDGYSYCSLLGAGVKSPTFSVKHDTTERYVGGAAVVAKHLAAAGAEVWLSTVTGEDELAEFVAADLAAAGIHSAIYHDATRPTTYKERFVTSGYKLLQVDRVDNREISDKALAFLTEQTSRPSRAVLFSDFRHGIFTSRTVRKLRAALPDDTLTVADSQVSNRWGNILDFDGFDLITPNEREARFALGDQESVVRHLAQRLFRQAKCRYLLLKLGERGLLGYRRAGAEPREFFSMDSFAGHVQDPIGAGDALLAYASLALAVSGNLVEAAILGSLAAAVECESEGNMPVSQARVSEKLEACTTSL